MPEVEDFRADPTTFLAAHPTALVVRELEVGQAYTMISRRPGDKPDWFQFEPKPGLHVGITHSAPYVEGASPVTGSNAFTVARSDATTGLRFLLYQEDKLTYLRLDADAHAELVLTGPLNGCNIYVIQRDDEVYLFHVNDNESRDDVAANVAAKDRKLEQARRALVHRGRVTHRLSRSDYTVETLYRAFVFGQKIAGNWEFFYHTLAMEGSPLVGRSHVPAEPLPRM